MGLGRSYVQVDGSLTFDGWCDGIQAGRAYVGDGFSHFLDFTVDGTRMGEGDSELHLDKPATVTVRASVAAMLGEEADEIIGNAPVTAKPYWHIERARVKGTRKVPVEVVVNGYPQIMTEIVADGSMYDLEWELDIPRSSWVAVRILPSSHTNPVFVIVNNKPIRAFRRSLQVSGLARTDVRVYLKRRRAASRFLTRCARLQWCIESVEQCWSQKTRFIKAEEMEQAKLDYEHARKVYR